MSDVVIVGGACMGWATAHHLLRLDQALDVLVIERDPTLTRSSTMLSDGNVRIQFNLDDNILISKYAMEYLDEFAELLAVDGFCPDPNPRRQGNLFLVDEDGREDAMIGLERQRSHGGNVEWLSMEAIGQRHQALASDLLVGGTMGYDDGSVDPSAVVEAYRRKALAAGARTRIAEVERLVMGESSVVGVALPDGTVIEADTVIVCAGAWSADLLAGIDLPIPVVPQMRTVYVVDSDIDDPSIPSVFLPNGVYAIPEHDGTFLIAWSRDVDPIGFDFTPAPRTVFYDVIWPELARFLPRFDRLEVKGSWAGLYAQNTLDANGIIGSWDGVDGLVVATGFSGHGYQQCHAVGRYIGEIVTGATLSLDLSAFGPARIVAGEPMFEHAGRII